LPNPRGRPGLAERLPSSSDYPFTYRFLAV
jgi:hypothetical protein